MAGNKNKTDRIHDQLPKFFRTRVNPNWKALVETLGESDQNVADLIEEVRKQFFVKTASRPYIDRLGANFRVSRPKLVGMDDPTFRTYIPVLAYQPKQVKTILDLLLNIFFFRETTTAFTQSNKEETYQLKDGWELEYAVDQINTERIEFKNEDFVNIAAATAEEVASAINRQAQYSFAVVFDDRIRKQKFIRLFTNTIGSKGSVQVNGGRADIALQFLGFNELSGSGATTQWTATKVGETMTFTHTGGTSPGLDHLQIGDIVTMTLSGNEGSFVITNINLSNSSFSFINLFGTAGAFDHALLPADNVVRFRTPQKMVVYGNSTRSIVWEVTPGEIIVEMPATPPVVKRSLVGSAHINGMVERVTNTPSSTSLTIEDATDWPSTGTFVLQPSNEIITHILTISEDVTVSAETNSRFDKSQRYSYTSKTGNTLNGVTPNLPTVAALYEKVISTATRSSNVVTVTTTTAHGFNVGECVCVQNTVGGPTVTVNGTFIIASVPTSTTFTYISAGDNGTATGGVCRVERIGMSNDNSIVYLTKAQVDTGVIGPYIWSSEAAFVLSSLTSSIQQTINAGNNVRTLNIAGVNNIPNSEGFVIFDFGTEKEEGPVRYLYKPTDSSMQMDPAYVFQHNHSIGSSITVIRRKGAHVMSGLGTEYPAYITDPAVARDVLQELMKQVKSVGIFIEFLVRYPEQLYSVLDVYDSNRESLWPIGTQ